MIDGAPARDPFAPQADPALYVPRPETERILGELERAVRTEVGPVSLSGSIGIGKTLLLRVLERRLRDALPCFFFGYPALPAEDLCRVALRELGVEPSDAPEVVLLDWLRRETPARRIAFLIDDADAMPRATALALGTLANAAGGALRLVLAASDSPAADNVFAALGEARSHVHFARPMNIDETIDYVRARLDATGAPPELQARFGASTVQRLFEQSEGYPARLHALADAWVLGDVPAGPGGAPAENEVAPPAAPPEPASSRPPPTQPPVSSKPAPPARPPVAPEAREPEIPPLDALPPQRRSRRVRVLGVAAILAGAVAAPFVWPRIAERLAPAEVREPAAARALAAAPAVRVEPEPESSPAVPEAPVTEVAPPSEAALPVEQAAEPVDEAPSLADPIAPDPVVPELGLAAAAPETNAESARQPELREQAEAGMQAAVEEIPAAEAIPAAAEEAAVVAEAAARATEEIAAAAEPETPAIAEPIAAAAEPEAAPLAEETAAAAAPEIPVEPDIEIAPEAQGEPEAGSAVAAVAPVPAVPPETARAPGTAPPPQTASAPETALAPESAPQTAPVAPKEPPAPEPSEVAALVEPEPAATSEPAPAPAAPIAIARAVPGQSSRQAAAVASEPLEAPRREEPERAPPPEPEAALEPAAAPAPSEAAPAPPPTPIKVNINATPWASIAVDGRDLGYTPLADVPLAPGPHRFRAELPDGRVVERELVIDAENRHVAFE